MSESGSKLASFIENVIGNEPLRIEETLGAGFVRLRVSEAERRQAKQDIQFVEDAVCELARNSRDAGSKRVFVASWREGTIRNLLVIDDGVGIPSYIGDAVFEPRVTSKLETMSMDKWGVHGRGMALYSIRLNARESSIVCSEEGKGTALRVVFDTAEIPERADQSTFPVLLDPMTQEVVGELTKGPHNIVRTVAEVALECSVQQQFYCGSAAEILSTLVTCGRNALATDGVETCAGPYPFWLLPALAKNPKELQQAGEVLGIHVSERTCYRILNGELAPLEHLRKRLLASDHKDCDDSGDLLRDRRGLKVAKADLEDFSDELVKAFEILAQRYYLDLEDRPRIRIAKDKVTVTFPVTKQL